MLLQGLFNQFPSPWMLVVSFLSWLQFCGALQPETSSTIIDYLETTGFDETVAHFGNTSLPGEMTNSKSEESEAMENQAEFLLQSLGYGNGTNDDDDPQLPSDQVTKQIRFLLEGIVVAVIALFGVMGNLMSVYILMWRKLDLQVFLRRLLVLLAVFDTLFLVSNFLSYSLQMLSQNYHDYIYPKLAPHFLMPVPQIALTGSVYTIMAITVERYLSCCWPHIPPRSSTWVHVVTVKAITLFSIVFNLSRFFELDVVRSTLSKQDILDTLAELPEEYPPHVKYSYLLKRQEQLPHVTVLTDMRQDKAYIKYYLLLANCTVMVVIPLTSLIFLNWRICKALQSRKTFRASLQVRNINSENSKEREVTVSQILIAIVIIFVICHLFKVIAIGYEVISFVHHGPDQVMYPLWMHIIINLNHVALAANAAINIAIYICKDKKFRNACLNVMGMLCLKKNRTPEDVREASRSRCRIEQHDNQISNRDDKEEGRQQLLMVISSTCSPNQHHNLETSKKRRDNCCHLGVQEMST